VFRPNRNRCLPALAFLAAFLIEFHTAFAQATTQLSEQALVDPARFQATTSPPPQPTPEQIGDVMMARQRYQAAIEAYKKAPRDSSMVWSKMGIAYQMMYNLQEASQCYQASLRLNPSSAPVLNNLGTVYDAMKDYSTAERMYGKALKVDSRSALIRKNLGTALLAEHKYEQGWEVYQAALAIDPQVFDRNYRLRVDNPSSVQERGAINYYMAKGCLRTGQNDRAIEYLRMALNEGFMSPKKIVADSGFAGLRGVPAFERLLVAQSVP
jgi:tetratricopeptide (TPR) repeat protein